jgi:hypothetical protein
MNTHTAKPTRATRIELREPSGPTKERLEKAEGFYTIGDDQQGNKIYTVRAAPLERMYSRKVISGPEYAALQKYRLHWYHAGLEASLSSIDLDRVFGSDPSSMSGMAKSEAQAHHRKEWRSARQIMGHKTGIVVDNVICCEWKLEIAGFSIGYRSPYRARLEATNRIREAGYVLSRYWGIG